MKNNALAIIKNRIKLERMISNNEDYEKILKQSQKLDKLINIEMSSCLYEREQKTENH